MGSAPINSDKISVRLAQTEDEVRAAQRLRYKVFYEECKAVATPEMLRERRDFDPFDPVADHLIVVDKTVLNPDDQIVGTYRLLRQDVADKHGRFYTSDEYDITPLRNSKTKLLELGRSCVLAEYRTRPVLELLWQGISDYMLDHNIGLLFGCASFHGTDIGAIARPLSYLYHYHLAPEDIRPRALKGRYLNMNIVPKEELDVKESFSALPALIKGYLRVGTSVGDGAVIDAQFNTTDVCIFLDISRAAERYRKHYERKINRTFSSLIQTEDETKATANEPLRESL